MSDTTNPIAEFARPVTISLVGSDRHEYYPPECEGKNFNLRGINFAKHSLHLPWVPFKSFTMFSIPTSSMGIRNTPDEGDQPIYSLAVLAPDILQDLAVKALRVFRCQADLDTPLEEEAEVDETVLEAARILAAIHNNDIDLATKVIDSVADKSFPHWPSRAVAIFILMNFGLLSRGLWREELGFSRSTDDSDHLSQATLDISRSDNLFDSLYELWYSLLGESVQEELGSYIKGSQSTDIAEVSLRKAAVLIATITDAEIEAATETVEALRSVGSFRMPAEGIAFAALQRVESILAAYDNPYTDAKRDER
ncbi:hypothetical protein MD484_g3164, partial [Candolleomyces efflorescens]